MNYSVEDRCCTKRHCQYAGGATDRVDGRKVVENRTVAELAGNGEVAAILFDDPIHPGQTQSGSGSAYEFFGGRKAVHS